MAVVGPIVVGSSACGDELQVLMEHYRVSCTFRPLSRPHFGKLFDCRELKPSIVHFCGLKTADNKWRLGETDREFSITDLDVAVAVRSVQCRLHGGSMAVEVVVLNADNTHVLARDLQHGCLVPYVVGWEGNGIDEHVRQNFAATFYAALVQDAAVTTAFHCAVQFVQARLLVGQLPVLFVDNVYRAKFGGKLRVKWWELYDDSDDE